MKNITRKVSFKRYKADGIKYVDGEMQVIALPDYETTNLRVSRAGVEKHFKKVAGEEISVVIKSEEKIEKSYALDVETFMELATEIEEGEEEQEDIQE